jgi:hypothetical protein
MNPERSLQEITDFQIPADLEHEPNNDDHIRSVLELDGWQCAGMEHPFRTQLDTKTGRFETERVLSEAQIKQKYLAQYRSLGFSGVRIEVSHSVDGVPDESIVYVYLRRSDPSPMSDPSL